MSGVGLDNNKVGTLIHRVLTRSPFQRYTVINARIERLP